MANDMSVQAATSATTSPQAYLGKTGESDSLAYLTNPLDKDKKPEQHTSAFTAMNSVWTAPQFA